MRAIISISKLGMLLTNFASVVFWVASYNLVWITDVCFSWVSKFVGKTKRVRKADIRGGKRTWTPTSPKVFRELYHAKLRLSPHEIPRSYFAEAARR